ncbi:fumarylacetoacetate hydrolase family protein [Sphingobium sp.]|uniref:fumarylacetoacetate hydrolase family protein n=1 Tax=Sphingobium sp. TaxID=1912891 RepID=UPI0028BDE63E|nr:fumarylacetoacetate hydrolase family protein [Sphingobium sp.]
MTRYALGTFSRPDRQRFVGLVIGDRVAALSDLSDAAPAKLSVLGLLEDWTASVLFLDDLAARADTSAPAWQPVEVLVVNPPVDLPRQIFCTGANYRKHVVDMTVDVGVGPEGLSREELRKWAEDMMDRRAATGEPYVFTKPVSAVSGPNDDLVLPLTTQAPDWELELGVIIGVGGFQISRANALNHVAGYAIVNDISARDLIPRTDYRQLGTDWLRAKGQTGFLPFGPYLVPSHHVGDPLNLAMKLTVSGQVMQDESTSDMLFDISRQIEYISTYCRLMPGDLICTGSPAGNGTHYGRYLKPGDVMIGEIEGLGMQRALCVAP